MTAQSAAERRQFERRATNQIAHAVLPGKITLPCLIENVSEGGALLRFIDGPAPIQSFRLTIEGTEFNTVCELLHVKDRLVGVRFARRSDGPALNRYLLDRQGPGADAALQGTSSVGFQGMRARPAASGKALREQFFAASAAVVGRNAKATGLDPRAARVANPVVEVAVNSNATATESVTASEPGADTRV